MVKVKVGIVGCGSICEFRHAPEYASNSRVQIVAFFDPVRGRAEAMARRFGGTVANAFTEITRDPGIDAISDCSTNEMHHVISTDALEHGKHVLCEKPIAVTADGARKMLEAARRSGRILAVDYNQRLAPGHRKAKQILGRGELGRVLAFQTSFGHRGPEHWSATKGPSTWFFDPVRSVFGAAGDLGIHKIDLLRWLLDDEIEQVSCFAGTLDKKGVDGRPIAVNDNMVCVLRTRGGRLGTLSASWTHYGTEDNSTTLYCERGIMRLYGDPAYEVVVRSADGEAAFYKAGAIQTNDAQVKSGMIDAFIDAILTRTPPPATGEDGLAGLQVVLAAMESAAKGTAVNVDDKAGLARP